MKKSRLIPVLLVVMSLGSRLWAGGMLEKDVDELNKAICSKLAPKDSVAVLDFKNLDGQANYFGVYLANAVATRLANNSVKVIERDELERILDEQKMQVSGVVDPDTAVKIGKLMGATSVVLGTITDFDRNVDVNVKIIGVETGENRGGGSRTIKKTRAIRKLIETITKAEKEKEAAIEAERTRVLADIEAEKRAKVEGFKKQESEMREKLSKLDSELSEKSAVVKKYKAKEDSLQKLSDEAEQIMERVRRLSDKAKKSIRCGMTHAEVVRIMGPHRGDMRSCGQEDCYNYGSVWMVVKGNLVIGIQDEYYKYGEGYCP